MKDLTDRQRFALRESLCDVLSGYSEGWSASSWDAEAVDDARKMVGRECDSYGERFHGVTTFARHLNGLVELLGEWPVGYRGEGGWEKVGL